MVNMARIASMTRQKGEAEIRRGARQYFNNMGRSTRITARLQLPPEVLERLAPPLRGTALGQRLLTPRRISWLDQPPGPLAAAFTLAKDMARTR